MSEFVVFRDHDGWFQFAHVDWWEHPMHKFGGERLDTRMEITRCPTREEAHEVRVVYNMMMHKRPDKYGAQGELK